MSNQDQIEYWNGARAQKWVALQETMDSLIGAHGKAMLGAAAPRPGETILDVGCGCGATSIDAAERVGPGGHVLGLDASAPMLARAVTRARAAGLTQAHFERGDAQIRPLGESIYDAVISRFGVMFFADPVEAFSHFHAALRVGGRLAFICWQAVADNPWVSVPATAVASVTKVDSMDGTGPGPFAFADRARLSGILEAAGFRQVNIVPFEVPMLYPGDLDEAAALLITTGPSARALVDASDAVRKKAADAVKTSLLPYVANGGLALASRCWLVTARREAVA